MNSLRPLWVFTVLVIGVVAGYGLQIVATTQGYPVPVLHWTSLVTMGAAALFTLIMGIRIKAFTSGRTRKRVNPIAAARALVLAQASVYAGTTIAGWHGGILLGLLASAPMSSSVVKSSLVMIGGALVMVIVGWVVEQFCKLPPEDPSDPEAKTKGKDDQGYAAGTN